ncbi:hypothetical protein MKW98_001082 [Papaver atlanticum]|uniref:Choline transporter-like protein n=1 Tax=Papaver atlanticum TaxID=357466 RepID=A0AAD4XJJ1_9MAGN|nr:hypothetical protein MKW98_001082 [Papaver atlanticum]
MTEDETSNNFNSPSQPLLSKPPYSMDEPPLLSSSTPDTEIIESDENQYPIITFNYDSRNYQDLPFSILFFLFLLSTFAFGIFSIFHRNPNSSSSDFSSFTYNFNTSSCVKIKSPPPSASSFLVTVLDDFKFNQISLVGLGFGSLSSSHVLKDLILTLVITLVLSGPFALGLLWLLRHYTKQIIYSSIPFFVAIPIFFNVYWFVACTVNSKCSDAFPLVYRILALLFVFVIIGVIVWIIVVNWHRIELTVRIVGVASDALARNLGLFAVLPCLTIGLVIYYVPIVVFLVFSLKNGKILPHVDNEGSYTCVWKQDSWVPAYYALAILTMLWSAAVMVEAQVFLISGTIAQWYFSEEESMPMRSIRCSLRNAFGPSFGTVCFSGLLIAAVRIVRAAVDSARREDALPGIVNLALRCCVNALLSAVDFLNKFTINFAAITGEAYCSSAKMTYELLKRNLLSAVFVETVSTRILAGTVFVLSAIYAIMVCAILKAVSDLEVEVYFVAVIAGLLLIVVLGFFVHVLDNVIETVYVCFAIDRDKGEVFKQEVHDVYVHLPISRNHTRTPLIV